MLPPRIDKDVVQKRIGPYADKTVSLEQRGDIYKDLLGFVPPRIEARLNVTGAIDPTMVDLQEQIREHGMYPKCFDVKTAQLMLFGMLLMDLSDAAILHGIAARKAGCQPRCRDTGKNRKARRRIRKGWRVDRRSDA